VVLGRVGLTGATGMLGQHMRAALEAAGGQVVPVSRSGRGVAFQWDMEDWLPVKALDAVFGDVQAVIHAGAIVNAVAAGGEAHVFDVNVRACANLAEWAILRSIPLVFISSACVYADPDSGYLSEGAPLGANKLGGFYGMTKLMAEDVLGRYRCRGLKLAVVRPSSLYGYGRPGSKMLYKFLDLALRGEVIELAPPVDDRVDFLHAADLSNAVVRVLKTACWDIFNFASEQPISIQELAFACIKVTGNGHVRVQEAEPMGRPPFRRFFLDTTAARKRLGWAPTIGIQEGLEMVLSGRLVAGQVPMFN
jgi:UDP-glucose 4-epimerase